MVVQGAVEMKTSELTGNKLCYAACMIEMPHLLWGKTIGLHEHSNQVIVAKLVEPDCYSPFMGWALAGPIIERGGISTYPINNRWWATHRNGAALTESGDTLLEAAMRCYVASKLGDEVNIPEELK